MRTNIFAITEPDCTYPAYVSLNTEDGGDNSLTVRSRGYGGNSVGSISMTDDQLRQLAQNITEHLDAPAVAVTTMITFDGFVRHGIDQGVPLTNGMPWSFTYKGLPVTHENDQCYLINIPDGKGTTLRFTPDDVLYTLASGEMELRPVL